MSGTINNPNNEIGKPLSLGSNPAINLTGKQDCVIAIRQSRLPIILKAEAEKFIGRNILSDCGRIPPNCFKAFIVKTAQKMGLDKIVPNVKKMFKSDIGYNGYFLDSGKLFKVKL